ncbi:universal stress protein [Rhodococcus sp. MS16]|nr:universal stress protein [Rhodococcus sp. MS16]
MTFSSDVDTALLSGWKSSPPEVRPLPSPADSRRHHVNTNPPIVVGIDGTPQSDEAVWWGAREAELREAPLLFITAFLTPTTYGTTFSIPNVFFDDHEGRAEQRLAQATILARKAVEGHPLNIHCELRTDLTIPALRRASQDAAIPIVGSHAQKESVGSIVSSALAVHSLCPFIIARGLTQTPANHSRRPILLGVDGTEHSRPAITAAFAEASLRGVDLLAVHAWSDITIAVVFPTFRDADWIDHQKRSTKPSRGKSPRIPRPVSRGNSASAFGQGPAGQVPDRVLPARAVGGGGPTRPRRIQRHAPRKHLP